MSTKVRFYRNEENIGRDVTSTVNGDVWAAVVDGVTAGYIVHLGERTHFVKNVTSAKDARNAVRTYLNGGPNPVARVSQFAGFVKITRPKLVNIVLN